MSTSKGTKIKSVSYSKYGYLFCIPFMLAFLVFWLYPTIYTLIIGFTDLRGPAAQGMHFLKEPFANFASILKSKTFREALGNTVLLWIINFIPQITLALLLTAWFTSANRKIRGQGLFKVMFYLPNIITSATVAILFSALFGYPMGPVNDLIQTLGRATPFDFRSSPWAAKLVVAFIQFWKWYGYTTIILISGVLGINPALFEAAQIDGASNRQTFFKVTLPCMRTILIFTLITSLIGGLNMFDIPKLYISNGGPGTATMTASIFIYIKGFAGTYQYNEAAAASMILFILVAILSSFIFVLMQDRYEVRAKRERRKEERALRKAAKEAIGT